MRTLPDALAALSRLTNYERTRAAGPRDFDLSRPRALLDALSKPDQRMGDRVVQIAGTKGKGSTARFVEGILRAAGLKTGLYTSPHLESPLERIAVRGLPIGEAPFARAVEAALAGVTGKTTFFEALLAAACLHFAWEATDAVILEVGLGGRLDATTAVPATHTIITNIGLDHTEILGDTLAAVAAEKAAIIRPGVPVWSGVEPSTEAGAVIQAVAAERRAPLFCVPPPCVPLLGALPPGVPLSGKQTDGDVSGAVFSADGSAGMRAIGVHQAHNAALAAAACADVPAAAIRDGIATTEQPGCCEPRDGAPLVVLDGAHTVDSVAATVAAVRRHWPSRRPRVVVLALARDKDLDGIAAVLADEVARVFCTRADDRRGRDPAEIAANPVWRDRASAVEKPADALDTARAHAGADGLVLVTGSLYLAGALRAKTAPGPWRETPGDDISEK